MYAAKFSEHGTGEWIELTQGKNGLTPDRGLLRSAGMITTPDLTTLFVNVQHPGEPPQAHPPRNDPRNPTAVSAWPDGPRGGRPRSATIVIRRADGGIIGT